MKKELRELLVKANERLNDRHILLRLTDDAAPLPPMLPGQFVQVRVDGEPSAFLRRPISIHNVLLPENELWLLVQEVGAGTRQLGRIQPGERLNVLLPLGRGFSTSIAQGENILLVGGGVGMAPLLYYGRWLKAHGANPTLLIGARRKEDLLQREQFAEVGPLFVTTEDGSEGQKGFVSQHTILQPGAFSRMAVCGPLPMMRAMAAVAKQLGMPCEVSLENRMACGLGACLCCVEKTKRGNVCVCTEGPVFSTEELDWNI